MSFWRTIDTATWDNLAKNDRVVLTDSDGSIHIAYVVDVAGALGFENEYGMPFIMEYDEITHWSNLPYLKNK